jgi:hypothetical protein
LSTPPAIKPAPISVVPVTDEVPSVSIYLADMPTPIVMTLLVPSPLMDTSSPFMDTPEAFAP